MSASLLFIACFASGLFLGSFIGYVTAALLSANDEPYERDL